MIIPISTNNYAEVFQVSIEGLTTADFTYNITKISNSKYDILLDPNPTVELINSEVTVSFVDPKNTYDVFRNYVK